MRGSDLVIISRSGGHAVVAADAAERCGFRLPPLPDDFAQRVRDLFRADVIAPTNPLDLGAIFDFDLYARIVEECLRSLTLDAVLLINTYSCAEVEGARRLARRVEEIVRQTERPVAFCVYAQGDEVQAVQREAGLPVFAEIEEAVRGLAAARDRHGWQVRRAGPAPGRADAPSVRTEPLRLEAGLLTTEQALALCRAYGIPVVDWEVVATADEAAQAADRLGYPVVLKLLSAHVPHKSDVGGVALGLADAAAVRREAEAMRSRVAQHIPQARQAALMVQRMAGAGVEVILGGKRDPSFGPVVMVGLGGVHVEVLDDVAFRVAPLDRIDAEDMVGALRGKRLLEGGRGVPPADREALIQALLAISQLLMESPAIVEVDVNPLLLFAAGAAAVDARVLVE